jgi:hypothetical protein
MNNKSANSVPLTAAGKRANPPRDPVKNRLAASMWRAKYPQKCRAIAAVGDAVRRYRIVRGECERCHTTRYVCAYHSQGYDKPLAIVWRCRHCHSLVQHKDRLAQASAVAISIESEDQ